MFPNFICLGNVVGSKFLGMCLSDIWITHICLVSMIGSMIILGLAEDTFAILLCKYW